MLWKRIIPITFKSALHRVSIDEAPLRSDIIPTRVLVATVHGKSYYKIITALKSLGLQFDSISPEEAIDHNSYLVITTKEERGKINHRNILLESELDEEPALIKARILRSLMGRYQDDQLIIGIDPGRRMIGLAAFYLQKEIESKVITSTHDAVDLVTVLVRGTVSRRKLVRIGFGDPVMARNIAGQIYARLRDRVAIEFVNEYGTSSVHTTDSNRRGIRDRLSARAIAFRKGRLFRPLIRVRN